MTAPWLGLSLRLLKCHSALWLAISILSSAIPALAEETFVSVCDRHPKVQEAINPIRLLRPSCKEVNSADLSRVFNLHIKDVDPSELKPSDFSGLGEVRFLTIEGDPKNKRPINPILFLLFRNLESIELVNIDLSKMPNDFLAHLRLSEVHFNNCNLREFPTFVRPPSLLDLRFNQLTTIPTDLEKYVDRQGILDVQFNNISDLSSLLQSDYAFNFAFAGNPIRPLGCEDQSKLFQDRIKLQFFLSINSNSLNMDSNCDLKFLETPGALLLHGGSLRRFSENAKGRLRNRGTLTLSEVELDNNLSELVGDSRKTISLVNTDLSKLNFSDRVWKNKAINFSIEDDFRSSLPRIFNGTQTVQSLTIKMPNLEEIPEDMFEGMKLSSIFFSNTPLSKTSVSTFKGVSVFGLPTNFGVSDTGGTSEEWAP